MKTFSVTTLGCRVNHYESEQIAGALRSRGLTQVDAPAGDVRVIHTCSVTMHAAKDSRRAVRKATGLPVLNPNASKPPTIDADAKSRVIVTGCWATSDRDAAEKMPGVDAVLTHHDDVNTRLNDLLTQWQIDVPAPKTARRGVGLATLSLLDHHQDAHQRAFLKIQDGCDAHCTYCIIPQLRPTLWSKPVEDAVEEARAMVASGHREIVLTGIFIGAFGQPTALRRRQPRSTGKPLAELIHALCTQVPGLSRVRLSSMEPGDLDRELIHALKSHPQVVPHFHLPLQSGSDLLLRKMNRQYTRDQFLDMIAMVNESFDRPAITTDIIVGFPGEDDAEFEQTLDVVDRARFIHTHAFTYSPRPQTAAARWTKQFVPGPVANERIRVLNDRARAHSLEFRRQFVGQTVTVLIERPKPSDATRHGRSERYFDVRFSAPNAHAGDAVHVCIDSVTPDHAEGTLVEVA